MPDEESQDLSPVMFVQVLEDRTSERLIVQYTREAGQHNI